jgi:hypothetical protein
MSYLRYLCLLAHSGVQHILCFVFGFVCLRLVYPVLQVFLDCLFLIAFRYSLTIICNMFPSQIQRYTSVSFNVLLF